jgi:hypothetical protein
MIGPLARPASFAEPSPESSSPSAQHAPSLAEADPKAAPPDPWPIERCAALAASIARRRDDSSKILDEHKLSPLEWQALVRRFSQAIRAETARGKSALLRAYDAAYVAQIERERGEILIDEYARLSVAAERGAAAEAALEHGLPRSGLIRIERVWLSKMSADPELRRRVIAAVSAAREA